jgi:antitoxin ParD1/3/4
MMTITVELPTHIEAQLRENAARQDAATVRRLLAEAVEPVVETLLRADSHRLDENEFETLADQLAEEMANRVGSPAPALSDYAVSREGIYEEHP